MAGIKRRNYNKARKSLLASAITPRNSLLLWLILKAWALLTNKSVVIDQVNCKWWNVLSNGHPSSPPIQQRLLSLFQHWNRKLCRTCTKVDGSFRHGQKKEGTTSRVQENLKTNERINSTSSTSTVSKNWFFVLLPEERSVDVATPHLASFYLCYFNNIRPVWALFCFVLLSLFYCFVPKELMKPFLTRG